MIIPKKDRKLISKQLFEDGVMIGRKDFDAPKHCSLDVKNLYVIKLMQSFKSRGYVTETFNWQWYYWCLTNEGVAFLRDYLHLKEEVVPNTEKKKPINNARSNFRGRGDNDRRGERRPFGDKKSAPGDFNPNFNRDGEQSWRRNRVGRGGAAPTPSE